MSIHDQLGGELARRRKIVLTRRSASERRLAGYVVGLSDTLCLLHAFDDFEPDGYAVLRVADITSIRSGGYERHWDRMLESERLLGGLDTVPAIDLSSLPAALGSAHQLLGRLVVRVEDEVGSTQDYFIGRVDSVDGTTLRMRHFDGFGVWASEPAAIPVADITMVELETPYIQRFWRYLTPARPASNA